MFPPFLISFFFIIYLSLHFETMSSSHTIGPSPSRNIGGESERDTQNVSSTPMMRSRTQIVTPAAATTNDHRHHQPWVHIDNRIARRSKRGCSSIEKLAAPKHYFTDRHKKYICLNFGIDPNVDAHKKVICGGCQKSLGNNLVCIDR